MNELKKRRIKAVCGAAVVAVCMLALYLNFGRELLAIVSDKQAFDDWLKSFGNAGKAVFVGIRALQTVVKIIPAEPLEIGSGYAYGAWGGLALCMLGTQIGSLVILWLSKRYGRRFTSLFVPDSKLESFTFLKDSKRIRSLLFFVYLIPGTPKDLITYFVYLTPIKPSTFLLITSFARIPSIITSTVCGAQVMSGDYLSAVLIFVATALAGIIGIAVYRRVELARARHKSLPAAA